MPAKVVLATCNTHKVREIKEIFQEWDINFLDLNQWPDAPDIIEDGTTFGENAIKKATAIAQHTGLISLADDSGIEVDYLNGAPGIYSARFSGEKATDEENNNKLLVSLQDVPKEKRTARYRCVIAIATPLGEVKTAEGICEGLIATKPVGSNGFGYDPIFYYPPLTQTFGITAPQVKNKLSHRYYALMNIKALLLQMMGL
ncbi:MAG: XTP/dITP diphosphatase [Chlamydiota bacterium]|nr:XTP/dITP diphosphatase [Chlamydiota bacterium]